MGAQQHHRVPIQKRIIMGIWEPVFDDIKRGQLRVPSSILERGGRDRGGGGVTESRMSEGLDE